MIMGNMEFDTIRSYRIVARLADTRDTSRLEVEATRAWTRVCTPGGGGGDIDARFGFQNQKPKLFQ